MASPRKPFDEWKKVLQQYCHNQDWMEDGDPILWNAVAICEMSKTSWQMGKLRMKDELENHSKDQYFFLEQWLNIFDFSERSIQNSSIWQESVTWYLSWLWVSRWVNLERRYSYCRFTTFGQVGRIRNSSSKNQRDKRLRISRTDRKEGRSQQSTSKWIGESHPTESTDDAEALADFWSIQGDFSYRHHNELQVQLYLPKEEAFPIPQTYIDATRSNHTDLDALQGKRIDDYWNVDSKRSLSDSWKGFTKFALLRKQTSQRILCGPGRDWQKFNRLPDQIMYGQKYGRKLVKPLRIEKKKNGQKRSQSSTMLGDWEGFTLIDPDDEEYKETFKYSRRKLERLMAPAMLWKKAPNGITKVFPQSEIASEKNPKTVFGCMVESHASTRQRVEFSQSKKPRTSHCRFRIYFDVPLQVDAQVYSYARSDEDSRCKSRSK